jgi:hypothetical protein
MIAPILIALAAGAILCGILVRPRMLDWGSTPEERRAALPGDDLVPEADTVTTRATTIGAPVTTVWPWLVQMGQDRAGFYTHNWVERLLRSGIPDTDEINPAWQQLEAGDLMRTNRDMGGKPMGWPVMAVDPGRSIVARSNIVPVGTYAFVLQPVDDTTTRFIVRDRAAWKRREWLFKVLVYELLHAYMETGLLEGIRQRAEQPRVEESGGVS